MSKAINRLVLIIGLLGVGFFSGCGVTSTSLPSNLQPGGGGFLTIATTQFQDAIQGRTYRITLNTTGGSGALSGCSVVSGTLPAGLVWSTSGSTCILSTPLVAGVPTGAVTAAPGSYPIVVQATDTSSPPKTDQLPYTITVRSEFSITQALLADTVQGRTYGTGSGCAGGACVQAVTTSLAATAPPIVGASSQGNGPIATSGCAVSIPNNPGLVVSVAPTANQCKLASTAPLASAGTYAVTISVTDSPIMSGTNVVVPANTITKTLNLNVNSPISFSANFDNYSLTPTGTGTAQEVPDAVPGRTYGAVGAYGTATAGGKTSLIFTATGGLLTTAGLSFTPPAASSLPTPMQCAPATGMTYPQVSATAATMVCNSNGAPVSASPGSYSFGVTVADAGNVATPAGSTSTDALGHASHTLTVDPALSLTLTQLGNSAPTNPTNLLGAIAGRTYGVVGGTPTYTPAGGLGANSAGALGNSYYEWCIKTGSLPATFSSAGNNLNTPCTAQVQSPSETLQATSDITGAVNPYPFTVQLNDTGNPTTPGASVTNSTTLTVAGPLVATLTQNTNATPTTALLPGVYNRSYGVVGGGTPTFTATGGSGAGHYQWCVSAGALPTGFLNTGTNLNNANTCTAPLVADTATLAANPITQNVTTPTAFPFTVRLDDLGNPAVPSGAISGTDNVINTSILVNPRIQLAQSLGANWPDAVNNRAYGSGSNCTGGACAPAVYTASYGLGGYVWPASTPAAIAAITGMACPVVAVGSATYTCSATAITAPPAAAGAASVSYAPSALVTDTANAATPAATTTTDPASMRTDTLFVNAPLLVTLTQNAITNPPSLIPGAANRSYGTVGAAPTYTGKGGLGARTPSTYEWCVNTGASSLPAGLGGIGTSCSPAFTTTGAATDAHGEQYFGNHYTALSEFLLYGGIGRRRQRQHAK